MTTQGSDAVLPYDPELAIALEEIERNVLKFEKLHSIAAARASHVRVPAEDLTLNGV